MVLLFQRSLYYHYQEDFLLAFTSDWNNSESVVVSLSATTESSLNIAVNYQIFLNNFHYSNKLCISIYIFCIIFLGIINFFMQLVNAYFLNTTSLFRLSVRFTAALRYVNPLVILIVSFTSIYASLWWHKLDFNTVILISLLIDVKRSTCIFSCFKQVFYLEFLY